jgi:hypothetical protein
LKISDNVSRAKTLQQACTDRVLEMIQNYEDENSI